MSDAPRPKLTALDEGLCHQIPEPFPTPFTDHPHWRESLFFIAHSPDGPGDIVILTLASFPTRGEMDALQLGRIGDAHTWGRHVRHLGDDPHALEAGSVKIEIVEPFREYLQTVQLNAPLHNGEPETGAGHVSGVASTVKGTEQSLNICFGNPHAVIANPTDGKRPVTFGIELHRTASG